MGVLRTGPGEYWTRGPKDGPANRVHDDHTPPPGTPRTQPPCPARSGWWEAKIFPQQTLLDIRRELQEAMQQKKEKEVWCAPRARCGAPSLPLGDGAGLSCVDPSRAEACGGVPEGCWETGSGTGKGVPESWCLRGLITFEDGFWKQHVKKILFSGSIPQGREGTRKVSLVLVAHGCPTLGGGGACLLFLTLGALPTPPPHNQTTFGPTEGQNVQWREANRRRQRQTTQYRGIVQPPPPPRPGGTANSVWRTVPQHGVQTMSHGRRHCVRHGKY